MRSLIKLVEEVWKIAVHAGATIMASYRPDMPIYKKTDHSPITDADTLSHILFTHSLSQLTPEYPILSEESDSIPFEIRKHWKRYWLIDPLDGTLHFIAGTGEFSINIALIENQEPILGIIYLPAERRGYWAVKSIGAFKQTDTTVPQSIAIRSTQLDAVQIVLSPRSSKKRIQYFLQCFPNARFIYQGGAGKFGLIAEGIADLYPRIGESGEWDTAAGQCIIEAAGGAVMDENKSGLKYNTRESLVNPPFFAVGDLSYGWWERYREAKNYKN